MGRISVSGGSIVYLCCVFGVCRSVHGNRKGPTFSSGSSWERLNVKIMFTLVPEGLINPLELLMFWVCVCSVYYQPNSSRRGGPLSRPPADCALGSVGNPFDRVWPPTTSGYLQPIFSCVDSRGTHPLCVYVREYGMWYVRGYVLGEGGVNTSTSRGRNSKLEG